MVRLFWALMAVVFVGAAAVVFMRGGGDAIELDSAPGVSPMAVARETKVEQPAVTGAETVESVADDDPVSAEGVLTDSAKVGEVVEKRADEPVDRLAIDTDAGASLDALLGIEPGEEEATDVEQGSGADASAGSEDAGEARVVDGGAVLGERFEVTGSGTQDDPYAVGWEVLLSAQETYRPRQGKKEIPAWVQQIDGKYVRIDGFIVLPVMGGVMNEVLLARNEWDGCCIGVPPTAYDSVEVRLRADASQAGGRHAVNYGSIVGKIVVDPYLWKDWLISMYVMEDAVIERQGL